MEIPEVLHYPDPRLRQKSAPVSRFDSQLRQLIELLQHHLDNGPPSVGIAAPQIGEFKRVAIVDVSSMFSAAKKRKPKGTNSGKMVLVNPEIRKRSGKVIGREGCLSVPDYTGNVLRAETISVSYQTPDGTGREIECSGFEARAVLHELDHLDGILFLDRVVNPREVFRRRVYR